jgi:peptidyl-prolyl cis-trans isomerase SurA
VITFVRLFPGLLALAIALPPLPAAAQQRDRLVDGVAAVVNSNVITYGQVRELLMFRQRSLAEMYQGEELRKEMKKSQDAALKDLIDRQLILDYFNTEGFKIPSYVVEDRVNTIIREEFGGDRQAFVRTLRAQGFTLGRFRDIERDKIIVQAMRQKAVRSDFIISPDKVDAYYRKNIKQYSTGAEIKLSMIVLRPEFDGSDNPVEAKRTMAKEIRDKLAGGADFAGMAQMYSDDSTADFGGDWGWIDDNTLTGSLNTTAFAMAPGKLSDVIQIGDTFYIMKVDAKKPAVVQPLSEVREEITKKLIEEERIRMQDRWIDTLREKAYVKIY